MLKENRIHLLANYGIGIQSGVRDGRRIKRNWNNRTNVKFYNFIAGASEQRLNGPHYL